MLSCFSRYCWEVGCTTQAVRACQDRWNDLSINNLQSQKCQLYRYHASYSSVIITNTDAIFAKISMSSRRVSRFHRVRCVQFCDETGEREMTFLSTSFLARYNSVIRDEIEIAHTNYSRQHQNNVAAYQTIKIVFRETYDTYESSWNNVITVEFRMLLNKSVNSPSF